MMYTLILAIGLLIAAIGIARAFKTITFLNNSRRAVATVVDFNVTKDSDGDSYTPIFEFTTDDGLKMTIDYPISSSPAGWSIGEEAMVAYDPERPGEAKVMTFLASFGVATVLLMIAAPMIVLAACYFTTVHFLK